MAKTIKWEGQWSLGVQSDTYLEGEYRGLQCELFYNDRLGSAAMAWDWSFYDDRSPEPELAVARSDKGFTTRDEATADLMGYIDGYIPERPRKRKVAR